MNRSRGAVISALESCPPPHLSPLQSKERGRRPSTTASEKESGLKEREEPRASSSQWHLIEGMNVIVSSSIDNPLSILVLTDTHHKSIASACALSAASCRSFHAILEPSSQFAQGNAPRHSQPPAFVTNLLRSRAIHQEVEHVPNILALPLSLASQ